jgi:hypothetical protein
MRQVLDIARAIDRWLRGALPLSLHGERFFRGREPPALIPPAAWPCVFRVRQRQHLLSRRHVSLWQTPFGPIWLCGSPPPLRSIPADIDDIKVAHRLLFPNAVEGKSDLPACEPIGRDDPANSKVTMLIISIVFCEEQTMMQRCQHEGFPSGHRDLRCSALGTSRSNIARAVAA